MAANNQNGKESGQRNIKGQNQNKNGPKGQGFFNTQTQIPFE
jgi:hypothetical protein